MSIVGIILIIALIMKFIINGSKGYKFFLFKLSILISVFVNIGFVLNKGIRLEYNFFIMYIYVIYSIMELILKRKIYIMINKKFFIYATLLIGVVFLGFLNLKYNSNLAMIAPWDVVIDEIAYGWASVVTPTFQKVNLNAFRDLLMFILFCYFSSEYFFKKTYVKEIITTLKVAFKIFFVFILIEFIIDNFVKVNMARDIINFMFGTGDKTYLIAQQRYGIYSAYGLFAEPSYVGSIMIIYYSIIYFIKLNSLSDKIFFGISFIVIICSGSSSSFLMIPFGIMVFFKIYLKNNRELLIKLIIVSLVIPIISILVIILFNKQSDILVYTLNKLQAYINGERIDGSGYSRNFGNMLCYDVLKINPILGVGLGTTRGFGLIPGLLSNLGILGSVIYGAMLKSILNLKISKKNIVVFVIVLIYLTSIFSTWHLYLPVIICVFMFMNEFVYTNCINNIDK